MKKSKHLSIKLSILAICLFLILLSISSIFGRYKSSANIDPSIETALYVFKEDYQEVTLTLSDIYPRKEPFTYQFAISNTDGTNITETYLDYELSIQTTTNLPLRYELYLNQQYNSIGSTSAITTSEIKKDEHGTDFQYFYTETQTFGFEKEQNNIYQLVIYFPETYTNISYQDVMEAITIRVNSKQKI